MGLVGKLKRTALPKSTFHKNPIEKKPCNTRTKGRRGTVKKKNKEGKGETFDNLIHLIYIYIRRVDSSF